MSAVSSTPHRIRLAVTAVAAIAFGLSGRASRGEWRPIGPEGGTVFSLERDPHAANRVYAGTYFGGMYVSEDFGRNWRHLPSPFSSRAVFTIALDPKQEGIIYAGTFEHGIWRSDDAGRSWQAINNGLQDLNVQTLAVHPSSPTIVLAGTSEDLYRSTDRGETWVTSNDGFDLRPRSLVFDPARPGQCYLGTLTAGAFRSIDAGRTWTPLSQGLGDNVVNSLEVDLVRDHVLAGTGTGAFRLKIGEDEWEDITFNLPNTPVLHLTTIWPVPGLYAATQAGAFKIDPDALGTWERYGVEAARHIVTNKNGTDILIAAVFGRIVGTMDNGGSFELRQHGMQNDFVGAMASNLHDGEKFVYAGLDRGVYQATEERLQTWPNPWYVSNDLDAAIFRLEPHPTRTDWVFAGTELDGLWLSRDTGITWDRASTGIVPSFVFSLSEALASTESQALYAGTSAGLFVSRGGGTTWSLATVVAIPSTVHSVASDPEEPGLTYFSGDRGQVYHTPDFGKNFFVGTEGLPDSYIDQLVVIPDSWVLAVTRDGDVYGAMDRGSSWTLLTGSVDKTVFAVDYNRGNPEILYAATAGGGIQRSETNGKKWKPVNQGMDNPFLHSVVADPVSTTVLYAGSIGKVYRTLDECSTWNLHGAGLPEMPVVELHLDVADRSTLYASVLDHGIYRLTGSVSTWEPINDGLPTTGVVTLEQSETDPQILYAGTEVFGTFRSLDGGESWAPRAEGLTVFVRSMVIDPVTTTTLYAGSLNTGLFKSTDGAESWESVGLREEVIFDVAIDASNTDRLFVATGNGVIHSPDGGETYQRLGQRIAAIFAMVVEPWDRNVIYLAGTHGQIAKSTNGGTLWDIVGAGRLPDRSIQALAIDATSSTLYAAPERAGIYRSDDGGMTWTAGDNSVTSGALIQHLTVDPVSHAIYASSNANGMFKSVDRGQTWTEVNDGVPSGAAIAQLLIDPFNLNHLYAAGYTRRIFQSHNGGSSWTLASEGIPGFTNLSVLLADPLNNGVVYAGGENALFRTTDGGKTWASIGEGLEGRTITALQMGLPDPDVLYAGVLGDGVYLSRDGGATWAPRNGRLGSVTPRAIELGGSNADIYAGTLANGFVFSTDGGRTWSPPASNQTIRTPVTTLELAPDDPDTLYAGTGGIGVLRSTDGGLTWREANRGLDYPFLLTMVIDPVEPDTLYVGTTGGGVFVSRSRGDLWRPLNDGLWNRVITSLAIDAADHRRVYAGTEGGGAFVYEPRTDVHRWREYR